MVKPFQCSWSLPLLQLGDAFDHFDPGVFSIFLFLHVRVWGGGMCVLCTLPGGIEGEEQSGRCSGSPPGPHNVHTQLEKNPTWCQHEWWEEYSSDVKLFIFQRSQKLLFSCCCSWYCDGFTSVAWLSCSTIKYPIKCWHLVSRTSYGLFWSFHKDSK